ncbi:response regulator [Tundrisphaera sp. TA3]|uniref:response regulator n=1 Tax=Tundrisphaera sp. TA3 TaxID=3435775 RepID=UPI003EBCE8F5
MSSQTESMPRRRAGDPEGPAIGAVLVVDDSPIDRRLAGAIVEKSPGLRAIYASDGREALEMIGRESPIAVLTDLQMPEMDGFALVQEIRANHPRLPVILMTAYGSEEVAIQALRAGAANYVPKKALAKELGETLRQVLKVSAVDRRRRRILGALDRRESNFLLENDPDLISSLIELLQEDLSGMEVCDETARMRVGVALQEALSNALYHGNLEVSSDLRQADEREFYGLADDRRGQAPFRDRRIHIHARFRPDEARYTITDEGPGFDTSRIDRPIDPEDLMRVGGRGLLLIRTFMDDVVFNEAGNQITLVKRGGRGADRPAPARELEAVTGRS